MEDIWRLVLKTSIYSSVIAVVLLVLKTFLKDKITPKFHYLMWFILILKLIVPFAPQSNISLFNIFTNDIDRSMNYKYSIESDKLNYKNESYTKDDLSLGNSREKNVTPRLQENKSEFNKSNLNANFDMNTKLGLNSKIGESSIISILWFVFFINILIWILFTNITVGYNISRESYKPSNRVINIFDNMKNKLGISRNIKVLMQDIMNTPFLLGILTPKVMLPKYIEELSDKEIEYIVLHELAHYKRKDNIVNYLLILLQSIHWFNPIIWYSFKKIRQDMELATDERVLYILEENEKIEYGKVLIKILEKINFKYSNISFITMANNKKDIVNRIKSIKNNKKSRTKIYFVFVGLVIIMLSLVLLTNPIGSDDISGVNIDSKLDKTISTVLKDYVKQDYYPGELATEGHIVLGYKEEENQITVYTVSSVSNFEFKNDIFTMVSGQGAVPTVLIFSKDKDGGYKFIEEKVPMDGSYYNSSIKELFPYKYWKNVLNADKYYEKLLKEQEEQAKVYLKEKGINKEVKADYVEEKSFDINVDAYNKLLRDKRFERYPMHIGTIEKIEDKKRYIYQAEQEKSEDDADLIVFTKLDDKQKIVDRLIVEIVDDEIILVSSSMSIYTADDNNLDKIIEFMPIQIEEDSTLEDKLSSMCIYMQKEYFNEGEAKIFFEYIDNNGVAIINLANKKAWERHSEEATKGAVSKTTIVETLLQRQYEGEWIKGIKVIIDGKLNNEFENVSFDKVIYR